MLNQSYENIEIILINDGSTDSSEKICRMYEKKDNRIKYYYKKNGGVSSARNLGIQKVTGKYLMFLDADDYFADDYVETMMDCAVKFNSDLVTSDYTEVNNDREIKQFEKSLGQKPIIDLEKDKYMPLFLKSAHFNSSCRKLILYDLIKKNSIMFNENLKYGEDMLFSFEMYINSKKPIYITNFGYYYFIHNNSAMHKECLDLYKKHYDDNYAIYDYIKHEYDLIDDHLNCLEYKTFVTFNKISRRLCDSEFNLYTKVDLIRKQRKTYNEIFDNMNLVKYCSWKQKISYMLLKKEKIYLYIIIKILVK